MAARNASDSTSSGGNSTTISALQAAPMPTSALLNLGHGSDINDDSSSSVDGTAVVSVENFENTNTSSEQAVVTIAEDAPTTPTKLRLSSEELLKRDENAIYYSKSQLTEGDTLIYINFPGNMQPVDSTGFEISTQHRVHSQKLLATESHIFADLLSPTKQFRILRRKNLVNKLPAGMRYVLDLTPPEEGDEAVSLTAELSCSLGIRMWHRAEVSCGVSRDLVSGTDPIVPPQQKRPSNAAAASDNLMANGVIIDNNNNLSATDIETNKKPYAATGGSGEVSQNPIKEHPVDRNILEYCPIRHRVGIINLLQLIEGRDIRLDSAPKVWTLFALAKHFECEMIVRDLLLSWMIVYPNCKFIEILPEKSLEIGFGLKLQEITRAAFSVLVSEEAFSLVSRSIGKSMDEGYNSNQFGRRREDLNEDLQQPIEYASKVFMERIIKTFDELIDPKLPWLHGMQEYQKLVRFEAEMIKCADYEKRTVWLSSVYELINIIRHFIRGRILFLLLEPLSKEDEIAFHERRNAESYDPVTYNKVGFGKQYDAMIKEERILTRLYWRGLRNLGFHDCSTNLILDSDSLLHRRLADVHKVVSISPDVLHASHRKVNDSILSAIMADYYDSGMVPYEAYLNPPVYDPFYIPQNSNTEFSNPSADLGRDSDEYYADSTAINLQDKGKGIELPIRHRTSSSIFSGIQPGKFDPMTYKTNASNKSLYHVQLSPAKRAASSQHDQGEDFGEPGPAVKRTHLSSAYANEPQAPVDANITSASDFFSISEFLHEVNGYIRGICNKLLDTNDFVIDISLTDTILCLGPEEFKFLPLWAGGDDDDSGGVFDPNIPAAAAGPSGPGPSFHTGFSSTSSRTASEFGDIMSSVNTSLGVEDGFSEHLDRRRVFADDDMHSETFSEDSEMYGFDRKGKGVDRTAISGFTTYRGSPSVTASSVTIDDGDVTSELSDVVSIAASSATMDVDLKSFDLSDAATEMGFQTDSINDNPIDVEDEEPWNDEDAEEAFDFGDGNDDDFIVV